MHTDQEIFDGLNELRQYPEAAGCKGDEHLLTEAFKVPENGVQAWLSTLDTESKCRLGWEIQTMDASIRSAHAVELAGQIMKTNIDKLAAQQRMITQLQVDLNATQNVIAAREGENLRLQETVSKLQGDLKASNDIILARDSVINADAASAATLEAKEKEDQDKLATKTEEVSNQQQTISLMQSDMETQATALAAKEQQLTQQHALTARLQSDIDTKDRALAAKDSDITAKTDAMVQKDTEINNMRTEVEKLHAELKRINDTLASLKKPKLPEKK